MHPRLQLTNTAPNFLVYPDFGWMPPDPHRNGDCLQPHWVSGAVQPDIDCDHREAKSGDEDGEFGLLGYSYLLACHDAGLRREREKRVAERM